MTYLDCYLVPVPRANRDAYEALARIGAAVLREHGALRVMECWLDEQGPSAETFHGDAVRVEAERYPTFAASAGAGPDETVVLSWVEWPDQAARDAGMAKVTADPRMQFSDLPPTFDGRRLIAGSFVPMLRWP